ncbi:MAG: hypothetical protein RBT16_09610 [Desulfococcus multivorans]|jgi:hypothetical protein|nr:hypothetical protein [Desulfococcus multivorans]
MKTIEEIGRLKARDIADSAGDSLGLGAAKTDAFHGADEGTSGNIQKSEALF